MVTEMGKDLGAVLDGGRRRRRGSPTTVAREANVVVARDVLGYDVGDALGLQEFDDQSKGLNLTNFTLSQGPHQDLVSGVGANFCSTLYPLTKIDLSHQKKNPFRGGVLLRTPPPPGEALPLPILT